MLADLLTACALPHRPFKECSLTNMTLLAWVSSIVHDMYSSWAEASRFWTPCLKGSFKRIKLCLSKQSRAQRTKLPAVLQDSNVCPGACWAEEGPYRSPLLAKLAAAICLTFFCLLVDGLLASSLTGALVVQPIAPTGHLTLLHLESRV